MQRTLSDNERENLTLEKANEIISDFGKVMEERAGQFYILYDELPWNKSDIYLALIYLIDEGNHKERESIRQGLFYLFEHCIPDPRAYQDMLDTKNAVESKVKEAIKKGLLK